MSNCYSQGTFLSFNLQNFHLTCLSFVGASQPQTDTRPAAKGKEEMFTVHQWNTKALEQTPKPNPSLSFGLKEAHKPTPSLRASTMFASAGQGSKRSASSMLFADKKFKLPRLTPAPAKKPDEPKLAPPQSLLFSKPLSLPQGELLKG